RPVHSVASPFGTGTAVVVNSTPELFSPGDTVNATTAGSSEVAATRTDSTWNQPTAGLRASPSALASTGVISTTSRPPPSDGTRMTMPRPSLVTSSGPSPVRGFIAAISPPSGSRGGSSHPPTCQVAALCAAQTHDLP